MRDFLNKANMVGICMALILGVLSHFMSLQWAAFRERVIFSISMFVVYSIYCLAVERFAIQRLGRATGFEFRGNPLIKAALIRVFLLFGAAWFLYSRIPIESMFGCVSFSLLTYFFVSSVVESFRLLRR